jgi:hypothetical protein
MVLYESIRKVINLRRWFGFSPEVIDEQTQERHPGRKSIFSRMRSDIFGPIPRTRRRSFPAVNGPAV